LVNIFCKFYYGTCEIVAEIHLRADERKRLSRGLTQFDMMDHGFTRRQYQYIETGKRNITLKTLHRLAGILEIPTDKLLK
jgi:hypothetical protein